MLDYKVKIGLVPMRRNTTDRPKEHFLRGIQQNKGAKNL